MKVNIIGFYWLLIRDCRINWIKLEVVKSHGWRFSQNAFTWHRFLISFLYSRYAAICFVSRRVLAELHLLWLDVRLGNSRSVFCHWVGCFNYDYMFSYVFCLWPRSIAVTLLWHILLNSLLHLIILISFVQPCFGFDLLFGFRREINFFFLKF